MGGGDKASPRYIGLEEEPQKRKQSVPGKSRFRRLACCSLALALVALVLVFWPGGALPHSPPPQPKPTAACPDPVRLSKGVACRCTASQCGTIPDVASLGAGQALVVTSQGEGPGVAARFLDAEIVAMYVASASGENDAAAGHATLATIAPFVVGIALNTSKQFQTVLGFGGAFTDAAAMHYERFSDGVRRRFINQYYGKGGIGYTTGRVPMNSADFSRMNYVLDDVPGDFALEHFCLRDDSAKDVPCGQDYKTTVILAAQEALKEAGASDQLKLLASTWSAPLWYKDQNFSCKSQDGLWACDAGAPAPAMACTASVEDPTTCYGQPIGEGCHTAPPSPTPAPAPSSPPGGLRSANTSFKHHTGMKMPVLSYPTDDASGNCYNTGFLKKDDVAQASWALYFSKFIDAYKAKGIAMWGITVQNEPLATTSSWQSMYYTAASEASFLAKHLGPTMRKNHPEVRVMVHDDQTISLPYFASAILADPEAAQFVDGVAYHWYFTMQGAFENDVASKPFAPFVQNLMGGGKHVSDVWQQLQELPQDRGERFMLMTEACNGFILGSDEWMGPRPGDWGYGYAYSHDVMWQMQNNAAGWTDWNLLLGMDGGPNLAGNFVDAPILAYDSETFYQNPSFFHLAHFSKYVVPGSKRVHIDVTCGAAREQYCQAVGFLRPDGKVVVVITNDEVTVGPLAGIGRAAQAVLIPWLAQGQGTWALPWQRAELPWAITCGTATVTGTLPWRSIQTVVFNCS